MYAVRGPATWLHLIRVQAPELQLFLEQGAADICRVMQLSGTEGGEGEKSVGGMVKDEEEEVY